MRAMAYVWISWFELQKEKWEYHRRTERIEHDSLLLRLLRKNIYYSNLAFQWTSKIQVIYFHAMQLFIRPAKT